MNTQDTRASTAQSTQADAGRAFAYLRGLLFIGLVSLAGNAAAVITVNLTVTNDTDAFGNYTLIKNDRLKVEWEVTEDTDGDLHKNDKIQLHRVSDDEVVATAKRGRNGKTTGKVSFKVKETGELLYVTYVRKGNAGTEIDRFGDPDDGDPSIQAIDPVSGDDVTREIDNLRNGAVSISATAMDDEGQNDGDLCTWDTSAWAYGFFRANAGAGSAACDAVGGISLPHGRTVTELHCTVYDNDGTANDIDGRLYRLDLETGSTVNIFTTPDSINDNLSIQTLSDTTPATQGVAVIDNKKYAYFIVMNFSASNFTSVATNFRVYGCTVYYG